MIEIYLFQEESIIKQRVNIVNGSILVVYDQNKLKQESSQQKLNEVLSGKIDNLNNLVNYYHDYFQNKEQLIISRKKMLFFGGAYLCLKVKNYIFGKSIISQSLPILTVAAAVTIISDYPDLKKIYQKYLKYYPDHRDKTLILLGILLTLLQESCDGILLLFLKGFTDTLQAHSLLKTKELLIKSQVDSSEFVWLNQNNVEKLIPLN